MSAEVTQAEKDGAKKCSPIVLAAYDTFVLQWSNNYAWRCPRERLLAHYSPTSVPGTSTSASAPAGTSTTPPTPPRCPRSP
ncbi:hypothetical protein ACFTWF_33625 [Rhodococcus sp. NPDC056960]|uniref:hypothetical protein n=1 Tax=Rhodococcus TaxID=1827 RepID=UPI003627EE34